MNTSLFRKNAGTGLVLIALAAVAGAAFAGPSPQYWQQQDKPRGKAVAKTPAAQPPAKHQPAPMLCPSCKISVVTEYAATNVSGKFAPHFAPVGSKHECTTCGGAITKIRGSVTDQMKGNCPICGKAKPELRSCCSI
jgi:hypothetical protein